MEIIHIKTEFQQENALNQTCRVCLCTGSLLSLLQPKFVRFFRDMLHTNINTDSLPKTVCAICMKQLETTMGFVEKCRDSHNFLLRLITTQELLQEEIIIKDEGYELVNHNKCPNCGEVVKDLIAHFHSQKNCYPKVPKCPFCDVTYATMRSLEKHLSFSHGIRRQMHECKLCGGQFGTAENLQKHMDSQEHVLMHQEEEEENNESTYERPIASDHGYSTEEPEVQLQTEEAEILILPCAEPVQEQDRKIYKCPDCGKEYFSSQGLLRHSFKHNPEKYLRCNMCDRKCINNSELNQHMQIHIKDKLYKCLKCNKLFRRLLLLKRHNRLMHMEQQRQLHQCTFCGQNFVHKVSLVDHERLHTGEKAFCCNKCGKSFSRRFMYRQHVDNHRIEEEFNIKPNQLECHLCPRKYHFHKSLKRHVLKYHNQVKLCKRKEQERELCQHCGKEFFKDYINNHINSKHLGILSFECSLCDKKYAYKTHLRAHVRKTHLNIKIRK